MLERSLMSARRGKALHKVRVNGSSCLDLGATALWKFCKGDFGGGFLDVVLESLEMLDPHLPKELNSVQLLGGTEQQLLHLSKTQKCT